METWWDGAATKLQADRTKRIVEKKHGTMIDSTVSPTLSRHVAIYERVSTEAQSVEMQDSDLKQYCEQRRLGVYHIYIDHGVSGTRERRPALDQLMADA